MNQEKLFFETIANASCPGWEVKLQPNMIPGQMDLTSYTSQIYVVDTSTGWTAAGVLQPSGFAGLRQHFENQKLNIETVTDLAGQALSQLGRDNPKPGETTVSRCIELVAAALTATQTFKIVQPSGLAGHWVYIGYRMLDGSTICRPGFFRTVSPGFVDPVGLNRYVRQIVANDLKSSASTIGQMITRSGGAVIAGEFK